MIPPFAKMVFIAHQISRGGADIPPGRSKRKKLPTALVRTRDGCVENSAQSRVLLAFRALGKSRIAQIQKYLVDINDNSIRSATRDLTIKGLLAAHGDGWYSARG